MVGFRGEAHVARRLGAWAEPAAKRIGREQSKDWAMPPELEPRINAPPLYGRERLRRMVLFLILFSFIVTPVTLAVLYFSYMGR